ncbi:putative H/ACA ribonucleoprotein complex non-core subunit NAF1, partial [Rhexocercosporidium sp. MPI-PUGE-AT-0058]
MENSVVYDSAKASATDNIIPENQDKQDPESKLNQNPTVIENSDATTQDTRMGNAAEPDVAETSPPLTHALEALLGGLDSLVPAAEDVPAASQNLDLSATNPNPGQSAPLDGPAAENAKPTGQSVEASSANSNGPLLAPQDATRPVEQIAASQNVSTVEDITVDDDPVPTSTIEATSAAVYPAIPGLFLGGAANQPAPAPSQSKITLEAPTSQTENLGEDVPMGNDAPAGGEDTPMEESAEVDGEHPEWEVDSSPIESSSDDSSSDDSSDDESEEGDNSYKLLSPEEQARILMEGDGGSEDEGGGKAKGAGSQLRTKNEVPDVVVPKPDVVITAEMPITEVGNVEHIVENVLVIKARTSGENRALESGSVLCLEDRSVIGVVAEILGPVQKPLYSVMFTNAAEITEAGLALGTKVFYSEKHSTFVFTQALKAYKGSDASNLHDEEVGDEEMEFSDDEAEAEHKRRVKQKRIERRG